MATIPTAFDMIRRHSPGGHRVRPLTVTRDPATGYPTPRLNPVAQNAEPGRLTPANPSEARTFTPPAAPAGRAAPLNADSQSTLAGVAQEPPQWQRPYPGAPLPGMSGRLAGGAPPPPHGDNFDVAPQPPASDPETRYLGAKLTPAAGPTGVAQTPAAPATPAPPAAPDSTTTPAPPAAPVNPATPAAPAPPPDPHNQAIFNGTVAGTGQWGTGVQITQHQPWQDFKFADPTAQWQKNFNAIADPIDRFRYAFSASTGGMDGHNVTLEALENAGVMDRGSAHQLYDAIANQASNYAVKLGMSGSPSNGQTGTFQLGTQLWGVKSAGPGQPGQRYLIQDFGPGGEKSGAWVNRHMQGGPDWKPGDPPMTDADRGSTSAQPGALRRGSASDDVSQSFAPAAAPAAPTPAATSASTATPAAPAAPTTPVVSASPSVAPKAGVVNTAVDTLQPYKPYVPPKVPATPAPAPPPSPVPVPAVKPAPAPAAPSAPAPTAIPQPAIRPTTTTPGMASATGAAPKPQPETLPNAAGQIGVVPVKGVVNSALGKN